MALKQLHRVPSLVFFYVNKGLVGFVNRQINSVKISAYHQLKVFKLLPNYNAHSSWQPLEL
jgi:hypothetical protein